jgi:hypothetical protein
MNQGPPDYRFLDVTVAAGNLNDGMPGLACGWADYDRDGFLDLYVVNWRDLDNNRYPDVLYHNNGDGTFTDVTTPAGVSEGDDPYAGMGMNWGDYNNDGWPDIYVSNYLVTPNYLYENNGDGTFSEVAHEKNAAGFAYSPSGGYYGHTAGSSWADYDHDGDLDMWVSNLAHTTDPRGFYTDYSEMLRNNGPPDYDFTDVRDETGIEKKPYMIEGEDELHFGIAWGDYDNDGDYDMFIPQVKNVDYAYSYFFENNGDGTFTDVSDDVGVRVWNTDGACWADYNNDGYIDLITEGKEPFDDGTYQVRLFRNNGESGYNWLEVDVKSSQSNRASIGARVRVTYDSITMMKEIEGGTAGHAYQSSLVQHFGFGDYQDRVDVEVWWPSGKTKTVYNVELNQKIVVRESDVDCEITSMTFSDDNPKEGDIVTITARVQNAGNYHIDSATIHFIDDGGEGNIGVKTLYDIPMNSHKDVQIKWDTTDNEGIHDIKCQIWETDPPDEYPGNNILTKKIEVESQSPDLTVSSISFSDEEPIEGEIVTITAKILNLGNQKADSAWIEFYEGDEGDIFLGSENILNIAPVDLVNVQLDWETAGKNGVYTITVLIKDVLPEEDNQGNNKKSESIEVKEETAPPPPPAPKNNPPIILEFNAEPLTVSRGDSVSLTVLAQDPDGDSLSYDYEVSDGSIYGEGSSVVWYAPYIENSYDITVTVSDPSNVEVSDSIIIEVIGNIPPEIINAQASRMSVKSDGLDRVKFTVKIEDENGLDDIDIVVMDLGSIGGSSVQRMYDDGSNGDEIADDGIFSYETVIPEGVAAGEKTIQITTEDESGESSVMYLKINVIQEESEDEAGIPLLIYGFVLIFLLIFVFITIFLLVRRGTQ